WLGCRRLWPLWVRDSLRHPQPHLSLGQEQGAESAVSEPQQEVAAEEGGCRPGYHVGRKRPHTSSSKRRRPAGPPSAGDPEGRDARPVPPHPELEPSTTSALNVAWASPRLPPWRLTAVNMAGAAAPAPPRNKGPLPVPRGQWRPGCRGADGPYHCTECPGEFGLVADLHEHYMLHGRGSCSSYLLWRWGVGKVGVRWMVTVV
uniref:C2H2-type domain-containing protein n=1 Tax=Chelonoidis abingdonii TaxID=106734 RepID=A0A8C0IL54_CHEAB